MKLRKERISNNKFEFKTNVNGNQEQEIESVKTGLFSGKIVFKSDLDTHYLTLKYRY